MLKKLIIFTIGIGLLYGFYTGELSWNHCKPQDGLLACFELNPIVFPALIVMTSLTIIVAVDAYLGRRR